MPPFKKTKNPNPSTGPKFKRQAAVKCALEVDMEKRKANASPAVKTTKRSAFGDLTNAVDNTADILSRKNVAVKKLEGIAEICQNIDLKTKSRIHGNATKQTTMKQFCKLVKPSVALQSKVSKPKIDEVTEKIKAVRVTEPSCLSEKHSLISTPDSEDSIYVSANEEEEAAISENKTIKIFSEVDCKNEKKLNNVEPEVNLDEPEKETKKTVRETEVAEPEKKTEIAVHRAKLVKPQLQTEKIPSKVPPGVRDHDLEVWSDPIHSSVYAMDIFNYLKKIEGKFLVDNYLKRQPTISQWMRALLVDWMVEVQETFEINHESLYLAVKLLDLYLCKNIVNKDTLQLLGAACFLIATKYDEQVAIGVQEILFICDGAFTRHELVRMERNILKSLDYNLGIPLSYVFLRRYALCGRVSLKDLTMARYILELSLVDYSFVGESESKLAASSLLLALLMCEENPWTPTLEYYTGYKVHHLRRLTEKLNVILSYSPNDKLATIRIKYSHRSFFEVAKITALDELKLKRILCSAPAEDLTEKRILRSGPAVP